MIGEQLVANTTPQADTLIARAILRDIRHTPQKARRVVDLVRGMRADEALNILKFAPQAAGSDVYTLLNSAVANAKAKTLQFATHLNSGLLKLSWTKDAQ